jgi:single-stranded-DNA-specific exonuclease
VSADHRLAVRPYDVEAALRLESELGVHPVLAQVLVARGLAEAGAARAWMACEEAHDPSAFDGIGAAVELVVAHVRAGTRITVHGDYDVDGVCATAILVGALRGVGADVDWFIPGRREDGYGLSLATVERLAARGTRLLLTADCAVTAVDEVAAARAAGMDVVVTDHHAPRADGRLPDAPLVHPALRGYPCPELCAAAVAHKLLAAVLTALGRDPAAADHDLDLVALATVCDVVPLRGENRRLVREGLRAMARTRRPGLRALMGVAKLDPGDLDAGALGFRLGPRINAAGRLYRADAGVELLLTADERRAGEIAHELDRANHERREVEQRILWEAEAQVAEQGERPAYVLAGQGWHPGVIGIVASRIAERTHRPAVLVALDGEDGTGSGRSIPAFDLLGGLDACGAHLLRHGGHRAAAGLTIRAAEVETFRAAFEAHAAAVLAPEDLVPEERVDAVAPGGAIGLALAEELAGLAPFGMGNPGITLLLPAATFSDPRPMGDGKHVRFTVHAGGVRSQAVLFGCDGALPVPVDTPVDATVRLEVNRWNGSVQPRLVLRHAWPCAPAPVRVLGEPAPGEELAAALAELEAPLPVTGGAPPGADPFALGRAGERTVHDRRGLGAAGVIAGLVHAGERVLVVAADAPLRADGLAGRLGGFDLVAWPALEREAGIADAYRHVVALDPPPAPALLLAAAGAGHLHLAWGEAELALAARINARDHDLRPALVELYRALRDAGGGAGAALLDLLEGPAARPRPPRLAGRLLRILAEIGLAVVDREHAAVSVPVAAPTDLERSTTFRTYAARYREGERCLSLATPRAA